MSDTQDQSPKQPSGGGDDAKKDQNRRRRGGRNRSNNRKPKSEDGQTTDQAAGGAAPENKGDGQPNKEGGRNRKPRNRKPRGDRKPKEDGSQENAADQSVAKDQGNGQKDNARQGESEGRGRGRNRNKNRKPKGPVKEVKAGEVSEDLKQEMDKRSELSNVDFSSKELAYDEPTELVKPTIGITVGDLNGIGLEVIIKTLENESILDLCTPVVFGSGKLASYHRNAIDKRDFNFRICDTLDDVREGKNNLLSVWEDNVELHLGTPTDVSGAYALKSIDAAIEAAKEGKIDAIVTAPINKHNIAATVEGFSGHTGHLAAAFENEVLMILTSDQLKVATVTGHIPISEVASSLSQEKITKAIEVLKHSLKRDFGKVKPTIAVLGLNPHAGEMGTIGKEEQDIIAPAIEAAQSKDAIVKGPYPADGFFGQGFDTKFDAVLGMYHDQVLVPFKAIAMGSGTNFTAGLSTVRTSPDHGTAMHLAGEGKANENSFRQALFSAIDIVHRRSMFDEMTKDPLKKQKEKR
jgi:4-hydroxythreonine-4-phosphate dehydrogenase